MISLKTCKVFVLKKSKIISSSILLFLLGVFPLFSQYTHSHSPKDKYANADYYLIDSLNLNSLTKTDRTLIDSCLQLYHAAESDIDQIKSLDAITDFMVHEDWSKYQLYQYKLIKDALITEKVDSIRLILLESLATALNNIGYVYYNKGDINQAIVYYQLSMEADQERGDKDDMALTLVNIGIIYIDQGNVSKGLEYYNQSLKIFEELGNKKGLAIILNNMGMVYYKQGDIPNALEFYDRSLKINEDINNKSGIAAALSNIASVYDNQDEVDKALDYHEHSLEIVKELGDKEGIARSLNNIGCIYKDKDSIHVALAYLEESTTIYKEIGNKEGIARSSENIGTIKIREGKYQEALAIFNNSLAIFKEIEDKKGIASSLNYIGLIYFKMGNFQKAQNYGKRSMDLAYEIGYPERIKIAASLLSDVYEKLGYEKKALEMYKLFIVMRDSVNNEETQKATAQQQAKYNYEKQKAIDDAEYDKIFAIEKKEKEKQRLFTFAMGGGLGLVVVFLLFIFNRLTITKKQKKIIELKKNEVVRQRDVIVDIHKKIKESINYAQHIQSALLPSKQLINACFKDSFVFYIAKDVVAGDFYWMKRKDNKVLFAVADCTGHGVPGAMVSMLCNNALNRSVREYNLFEPGKILDKTREIIISQFEKSDEEVKDGMDIALCMLEGDKLQYAGAFNPLWIIRNGELLETKANRWPIGLSRDTKPFTTHTINLLKNDLIYLFSDGIVDQFGGEKGKKFKISGLKKLMLGIHELSMDEQMKLISEAFDNWKGGREQVDDVCIIGIRV